METPSSSSSGDGAGKESSVAFGFAVASLVAVLLAVAVRDEPGALLLCAATLLGLIGLGRGVFESAHPERFGPGVVPALVISFITGIGGCVLLALLIQFLDGYFPVPTCLPSGA